MSGNENVPVAHEGINFMSACLEPSQLDLLSPLDLLRITVAPLDRYVRVRVRVDEDVERAGVGELR